MLAACPACNDTGEMHMAHSNTDLSFDSFKDRFMDAYQKNNPAYAISAGYGKYYDSLKIPDSVSFANDVQFCRNYLDVYVNAVMDY